MPTFPIVDCDSHVWEPAVVWTKYLDPEYRVIARTAFSYDADADGAPVVIVNGAQAKPINACGINRYAIWRPGMTPEQIGALAPDVRHPINPGAHDASARLADMDAMGVRAAVLFPTLFAEYFPVIQNPDAAAALARAYNDWIRDFAAAAPERLIPAAVLPMQDVNLALRELRRVAASGFRALFIRPSFSNQRFPNHSDYAPLWREIEALGLVACVHPASGHTNPEWTSEGSYVERVAGYLRIGHSVAESVAPTMDNAIFLTAMCFCGHMEDFPRLKLSFLHSGASWVPLTLEKAETYLWLMSATQDVSLEPDHVFLNRPYLVGFNTWESSVARMPDVYANLAAWGSRYPHHDASAPSEALANLEKWKVPEDVVAAYLGGNAARQFGLN
jgi:predicted TIM-barrel fold metal-dependent hydrolase